MKILHDLLPCGTCGVFYVRLLEVNGLWLCGDCIKYMMELMNSETTEQTEDQTGPPYTSPHWPKL